MNPDLAQAFFIETSRAFEFLVRDCGFAPPTLEIDHIINFATVTFMGKNLAVECILDERERDIACKIARVVEGEKSSVYEVDENGVRQRDSLASLLRRRGVRQHLFRPVGGLDFERQMRITLGDFASMLLNYADDVRNDSPEALT